MRKNQNQLLTEISSIRNKLTNDLAELTIAEESIIKAELKLSENSKRYQGLLDLLRIGLVSQLTEIKESENVNALLHGMIVTEAQMHGGSAAGIAAGITIGGPLVLAALPVVLLGMLCVICPPAGIGIITVTLPEIFNSISITVDPIVAVSVTLAVLATVGIVIASAYAGAYWHKRNTLCSAKKCYQSQLTQQSLLNIGQKLEPLQQKHRTQRAKLQRDADEILKPLQQELKALKQ